MDRVAGANTISCENKTMSSVFIYFKRLISYDIMETLKLILALFAKSRSY